MNDSQANKSLISVIIPAYNCEKTILETINSVLQQTYSNFELIIINDGSQDSTLEIVNKIQDSRLRVFSFDNAGGNVSRNRGLHLAQGEFISFLDADDIWTSDKLHSQLEALEKNTNAHVAYSWTDYIDESGNFLLSGARITASGDVYEKLLINNFLENGSNPLIRKDALMQLGGFDEALQAAQDWDMWLRLAAKYSFIAVPFVQILYRVSSNSLSSNLKRQEKYCLQVLDNAYKIRPTTNIKILNISKKNIYKYLTCKALQQPLNRQKGITALVFLIKYITYNNQNLQNINFIIKLLLKIVLIITLSEYISYNLLTKIKTETKKKVFHL
jgi:glycosyltransferase involved in cell wall biosynthesis